MRRGSRPRALSLALFTSVRRGAILANCTARNICLFGSFEAMCSASKCFGDRKMTPQWNQGVSSGDSGEETAGAFGLVSELLRARLVFEWWCFCLAAGFADFLRGAPG